MSAAPRVLVVVPAHDEEEALPGVLREIRAAATSPCDEWRELEILVVDDGSSDASARVAEAHGATVIRHPANRGYGAALATGYRYALEHAYDVVVTVDGDGQHDASQIPALLRAVRHADFALGSRMLRPRSAPLSIPRRVGIHLFAALGKAISEQPITDPTSGFTAVQRHVLPFLIEHTPRDFPDLNVLIALERAGFVVREVPVTMRARRTGRSMNRGIVPFVYVARMLWYVYREARAPRAPRREATRVATKGALRVVLVNPPPFEVVEPWYDTPRFGRHGLASLAGYLRQFDDFDVHVVDAKLERIGFDELALRIARLRPDVVGLTAFTNEIKPAARVARLVRRALPEIVTVIGGVHVTALPARTMEEFPEFDVACVGEGEVTLHELCCALRDRTPLDRVDGLVWREGGSLRHSAPRAKVADLDRLPPPAWDLFPRADEYWVMTQRGCPFTCNFCVNPNGRLPRQHSVERVVREVDEILARYRPTKLWFADEIFSVDVPRTRRLLTAFEEARVGERVRWWAESHVSFVDEALLAHMKRAGCEECALGIESGSEPALRGLGKGTDVAKVVRAFEAARRAGLRTIGFFIFGHPNETPETMQDTIDLAVRLDPSMPIFGVMVPYPGTEVARLAARGEGGYRLLTDDWDAFNKQVGGALEFAGLTRRQIEATQLRAYVEVFARNGRWGELARFGWAHRAAGLRLVHKLARPAKASHVAPPSPRNLAEIESAAPRWSGAQADSVRRLRASADLVRARVVRP